MNAKGTIRSVSPVLLFLLFSGIWACHNEPAPPNRPDLSVIFATALRKSPGEKSPELLQLAPADRLADLGEVSAFLSGISLKDTLRNEPWLRVRTTGGQEGWVFAGAVRPSGQNPENVTRWALNKRFIAWFGPALAQRWQVWAQLPPPQNDSAAAAYFRQGLALRDTLNLLVSRRVTRDAGEALPDFFWLGQLTPLFIIQQIAGGTSYYLFTDYRVLAQMAARSGGMQDDAFVQVCLQAYPSDSIESALPVWVFPVSAETGYSNLGQGNHLKILKAIDRALQSGNLFAPELQALKASVMEDISDQNSAFWQPQEKILAELNQIIKANLTCINGRDRAALEARRNMFESPAENGIVLNLRSGNSGVQGK